MTEPTTFQGLALASDLRRLFGDQDSVQLQDADIVNWINAGYRDITAQNPILQMTVTHDVTAGTSAVSYPADRVQYIQAIYFNNIPLIALSYAEAQEYIAKNARLSDTASAPTIWWEWAQTIQLYPIPNATTTNGALKMDYLAIPVPMNTLYDNLSLPDRYYNTLLEYVLMKANTMDENWLGIDAHQQAYQQGVMQLAEQENKPGNSTYKTVTVLDADWW